MMEVPCLHLRLRNHPSGPIGKPFVHFSNLTAIYPATLDAIRSPIS